jgi:general secretion pathway protein L
MSLLRIHGSLHEAPQQCQWALISDGREPVTGQGPLEQLPQRAERVQLVLPAAEVLITRANLPQSAKRHAGSVLAFAVEEETLGDPDANQVSWLGSAGTADVLAVSDRQGLKAWHDALEAAGIDEYEVHCETLMLPLAAGEWSLAWDGREGFVRTSQIEGAATDCGDRDTPPMTLRLMLDEAKARIEAPKSIALHLTVNAADTEPDAAPDLDAWQQKLGVALRLARPWDWRVASSDAGVSLAQERQRWHLLPGTLQRLRPAAWLVAIALALHAVALTADWTRLAGEQRSLRTQMESRFRTAFPDAVAVADPALQMRRKLTDARHAAGQTDSGDFLPMIEKVATALKEVPAGALRIASYESGRLTLELGAMEEAGVRRVVARLLQNGMQVDTAAAGTRGGSSTVVLTVRAS